MRVVVGSPIAFTFQGTNWLYVGPRSIANTARIELVSTTKSDNETTYRFRFLEEGDYIIRFQNQSGATTELVTYTVTAVDDMASQDSARAAPQNITTASAEQDMAFEANDAAGGVDARLRIAEDLINTGYNTQALTVLAGIDETAQLPPDIAQQAAILATNLNEYRYARRFWERNLQADEPYAARARASLTTISVDQQNFASADIYARSMLLNNEIPSEHTLLSLAAYYTDSARYNEADTMYDIFTENYRASPMTDRYLWGRGRLLEINPDARNFELALARYTELVDRFPLSDYWEQANSRIIFIRRHFIDIR